MKHKANTKLDAVLCFEDGTCFFGKGIGKKGEVIGEICFNTSITGYQEILTDPSYSGQIITFTFPHIGNVGCNDDDHESKSTLCKGLIIREDITLDSNFRSQGNLNSWLKKKNLTGICNIDTRALTQNIRINGARNVIISFVEEGQEINSDKLAKKLQNIPTLKNMELCESASTNKEHDWQDKTIDLAKITNKKFDHNYKVAVLDFGIKENILNCLTSHGFKVKVFPANSDFATLSKFNPDGIFLSNGPGDPHATSKYASKVIQEILQNNIPVFGICMGHQLLAISCGLKTFKMKQGHRGANHPVKNLETSKIEITSQNHGFCVDKKDLAPNVKITHISLFDDTIQGIRLKDKPAFSVQYHPESSPGPHDSRYLFQDFVNLIAQSKKQQR